MRTSGFPCRTVGCDRVFQVKDQTSMDALQAASAERTEHELNDHSYHHVRLTDEVGYRPFSSQKTARK